MVVICESMGIHTGESRLILGECGLFWMIKGLYAVQYRVRESKG